MIKQRKCLTLLNIAYRINKNLNYLDLLFTIFVNKKIDNLIRPLLKYENITVDNMAFIEDNKSDEWKYSLDTQGFHNISFARAHYFYKKINDTFDLYNKDSLLKYQYTDMEDYIPSNIVNKLKSLPLIRVTQIYCSHCVMFFKNRLQTQLDLVEYTK